MRNSFIYLFIKSEKVRIRIAFFFSFSFLIVAGMFLPVWSLGLFEFKYQAADHRPITAEHLLSFYQNKRHVVGALVVMIDELLGGQTNWLLMLDPVWFTNSD